MVNLTKQIEVKITGNTVKMNIPSLSVNKEVLGVVTLFGGRISGVSQEPDEMIKNICKSIAETTDEEIAKIPPKDKYRVGGEEKIKKLRDTCRKDLKNGTREFWEELKKDYRFVYPFDPEQFDTDVIIRFFQYYEYFFSQRNNVKAVWAHFFGTRYDWNISYEDYDKVDEEKRKIFEAALKKKAVHRAMKIKTVTINGKTI